ncbi:uncharacterized protein LOC110702264, partial [Chenopodium quinoa]|uniref:uncharacterized protein LOC110702264 n=1 Tax=Chenopodium quinoa TaxID=63459 RepID=UPI000B793942
FIYLYLFIIFFFTFSINQTKDGEILDCVEINKQFALDNPLLHNHSIQMKPNFKISKQTTSTIGSYTISLSPPQLVPKSTRCPRGTVLIKRIREEDLALEKFSSSFKTTISTTKLTESITPNIDSVPGHYIATIVASTNNVGVYGLIVKINSQTPLFFVASDDGDVTNAIQAGWAVYSYLYQNSTRLYSYWTRDTGKITGCYNALCPGFVQVSQSVTLGQVIDPISTYWGHQVFTNTTIQQDQVTKNWWLIFETEPLGYFPKELFSTLANGATRAGWGGEVYTPTTATSPAMGSGNFPEDGYSKACLISKMQVIGPQYFPNGTDLRQTITKADCYRALYGGNVGGDFDNHMFVGGPANCNA